ncbi:hypothetical protein [Archaeoglobus neptunius]|uniref:hypothetical protein n=1 Tax=Archaeoglobus neptunius TaxID=2798580 RepID=UPI001927B377|nr:hypothetical protein [Archaeoglobus neptunius]
MIKCDMLIADVRFKYRIAESAGMKKVELYTYEDANRDVEEGLTEGEAAVKKWEYIVLALREIEEVALQMTPLCERYIDFDCDGCPLVKFDLPCTEAMSTYSIFCTDLKKLRMVAENMLSMIIAAQKSEERRNSFFV